jgi:phosphate transport system permease protein
MDRRIITDRIAGGGMAVMTIASLVLVIGIAAGLYYKSMPVMGEHSLWQLLSDAQWKPMSGHFGFLPFIAGTFAVTLLAVVLALPLSLLMAIYLTEYSSPKLRRWVYPLLDILAGLPSVLYGVWGTLIIVPWIADRLGPALGHPTGGYTLLTGGLVLSVMIIPLMESLFIELFTGVSNDFRESSLSLGATRWQTVKHVVLRRAAPGIIAAVVLAVSRALGETMAVMMVCGNLPIIPRNLLDACYPLPALIANNYGEMLSMPLYESALMFAALVLFALVLVFNLFARITLRKLS